MLRRVVETLPRYTYRFANEIALHEGMAQVLTSAGIEFQREFVAGPKDRFDFLLPHGIVIEAKVGGSAGDASRQVARYMARDDVAGVVLAVSRVWGRSARFVDSLHGKPLCVVNLRGDSF
jgi:hypothetical protein